MTTIVTHKNLGAWVLKCNPKTWDIVGAVNEGGYIIYDWSVQENYRSRMMKAGDPVLLWVTGSGSSITPGFWGIGEVDGPVDFEIGVDLEADEDEPRWLDEEAQLRARHFVPVWLPLMTQAIPRDLIATDPVLSRCEIMRQPQMSNPSWLSLDEMEALGRLIAGVDLPEREPLDAKLRRDEVAVTSADPITRALVEAAAVAEVSAALETDGWTLEDVQSAKVGWDLTAHKAGVTRRIEVKGRGVSVVDVMLTANEMRSAREDAGWELAVVTDAMTRPMITWISAAEALGEATPFQFRLRRDM